MTVCLYLCSSATSADQLLLSLRFGAFSRDTIGINELAKFGQFVGGELASFDEVNSEAAGGTVEDAIDELANHRTGSCVLCDGGRPLVAAADGLAPHEAFIEHYAKDGGDGGGGHFAVAAERFADFAERRWAAVPEGAEDFEFAIGWMLAGGARHFGLPCVGWETCGRVWCGVRRPAHNCMETPLLSLIL